MIVIAAMTETRLIGRGGALPWDIPEEYARFLATVRGQTVVLGRRSYEIFGRDLTSTRNVVLSRTAESVPGANVARSWRDATALAASFGTTVYCAGGAAVYRLALPTAEAMVLSIIRGSYEGDVWFPEFDEADWAVESRENHARYELRHYRRTRP